MRAKTLKKVTVEMSEKIFLSRTEQLFLLHMFELNDVNEAAEAFVTLMIEEKAEPTDMKKYLTAVMAIYKDKFGDV